jgi:hypothetical protein
MRYGDRVVDGGEHVGEHPRAAHVDVPAASAANTSGRVPVRYRPNST